MNLRSPLRRSGAALALVVSGQLIIAALGPLTRVDRAFGGSAGRGGIALLSSDSLYYLGLAEEPRLLESAPITRVVLPLILRLGAALGSAETFAVTVNFFAFILAALALYDLGRRFGGTESAGLLAAGALVINPLTSQWVRFVLTESLSYAAVVLLLWSVIRLVDHPPLVPIMVAVSTGLFVSLLRPNGVLLFAGALTAIVKLVRTDSTRASRALVHLLIWSTAAAVFFAGSREPESGPERTSLLIVGLLYDGVVVEGTPEVLVTTPMPPPSNRSDRLLSDAARYATSNPLAVLKLGVLRVGYETLQLRPHYPRGINLTMGAGFAAFLLFVLVGARAVDSRPLRTTVLVLALPQVLLVSATFAVPESRYGWTYLVTLCAWAGVGADRLLRQVFNAGVRRNVSEA